LSESCNTHDVPSYGTAVLTPHASKLGPLFENRGWRIEILEPNNFEPGGRSKRMLRLFSADVHDSS
jgi:hypothetical protein